MAPGYPDRDRGRRRAVPDRLRVLGINAVFHDPAAALVVDGETVAAAEEERYSRRKHGKQAVPFSTWELPVAAANCLVPGKMKITGPEVDLQSLRQYASNVVRRAAEA